MRADIAPWNWKDTDAEGALGLYQTITAWVTWLVHRYQLDDIPPCWYQHGALTEELTALWAAWTAAYHDPNPPADAALTWHERLQTTLERIQHWDRAGCARGAHRNLTRTPWHINLDTWSEHVAADVSARSEPSSQPGSGTK